MERRSLRDITAIVARAQAEYGGCFACGVDNPIGMRLDGFRQDESGWVEADFVPRPDYRGAHESLHGGISASAIDEILVWAGIVSEGVLTVTATLDLKYRRPISIHDAMVARGRVEERRGRRLMVAGQLQVDGKTAVEGRGVYLVSRDLGEP
jgi:acyl-coenzyme A thioesterase PaaI-like protein